MVKRKRRIIGSYTSPYWRSGISSTSVRNSVFSREDWCKYLLHLFNTTKWLTTAHSEFTQICARARVAEWARLMDYLTTHTSLSPIRRGWCILDICYTCNIGTCTYLIWFLVFNATFSYIMATRFSGGRSRREPPTMGKQLILLILSLLKYVQGPGWLNELGWWIT
jgi:hypothetical protein